MGQDFTCMLAPAAIAQNCQNRRRMPKIAESDITHRDEFGYSAFQFGFFGNFRHFWQFAHPYIENEIHFHLELFWIDKHAATTD